MNNKLIRDYNIFGDGDNNLHAWRKSNWLKCKIILRMNKLIKQSKLHNLVNWNAWAKVTTALRSPNGSLLWLSDGRN